jgi:hypothetical protein
VIWLLPQPLNDEALPCSSCSAVLHGAQRRRALQCAQAELAAAAFGRGGAACVCWENLGGTHGRRLAIAGFDVAK